MNKFIKGILGFSLRHPYVVFFITALVVVAGAVSFYYTPVEAYPDVTNTEVVIITQWPGRSAEEVERFISIKATYLREAVLPSICREVASLSGLFQHVPSSHKLLEALHS